MQKLSPHKAVSFPQTAQAIGADDDVIDYLNSHQGASLYERFRSFQIFFARCKRSTGMIVSDDNRVRIRDQSTLEHFTRMH
jgi:hypothetical protein